MDVYKTNYQQIEVAKRGIRRTNTTQLDERKVWFSNTVEEVIAKPLPIRFQICNKIGTSTIL